MFLRKHPSEPSIRGMSANAAQASASPPPLVATLPGGCVKDLGRQSCLAVFVRVEAGEMLANDLLFGVALDPLCTLVPVGDSPVRVEHVDGVVKMTASTKTP